MTTKPNRRRNDQWKLYLEALKLVQRNLWSNLRYEREVGAVETDRGCQIWENNSHSSTHERVYNISLANDERSIWVNDNNFAYDHSNYTSAAALEADIWKLVGSTRKIEVELALPSERIQSWKRGKMSRRLPPPVQFVRSNRGSRSHRVTARGWLAFWTFAGFVAALPIEGRLLAATGYEWLWLVIFFAGAACSAIWFIVTVRQAPPTFQSPTNDYLKDKKNA
jgi:hypothetical protein